MPWCRRSRRRPLQRKARRKAPVRRTSDCTFARATSQQIYAVAVWIAQFVVWGQPVHCHLSGRAGNIEVLCIRFASARSGAHTVTSAISANAISEAGTVAVSCEPLTNVVTRGESFQFTTERGRVRCHSPCVKFDPPGGSVIGTSG